MQPLPIAHRELSVAARRASTSYGRVATAALAFAILAFILGVSHSQARVGTEVLQAATIVLLLEALLAGVRYTCDSLSEERREGTLGLLFLTPLTGWDVVIGKSAARAVPPLSNFIAVIPVFACSVLFGGVTGMEIAALATTLVLANLLSLAAGLAVSARETAEKKVLAQAFLLVGGIALLPFVVWQLEGWTFGTDFCERLLAFSPVHSFALARTGFSKPLLVSCLIQTALAATFLSYAAWKVSRSFRDEPETENAAAPRVSPFVRVTWRNLLQMNPFFWLAVRDRAPRRYLVFACCLALFGLVCRVLLEKDVTAVKYIVLLGSYGLHAITKFMIAEESLRRLNADRHSGALELLLTTPLSPSFILRGQQLAVRKLFRPVLVGLALMNLFWMTENGYQRDLFVTLPGSLLMIYSDARALVWVGMLNALRGQRHAATALRTFFQVVALPAAAIALLFFLFANTGLSREGAQILYIAWIVGCILYNFGLETRAKARFQAFRSLASGDRWQRTWVAGGGPVP